MNIIIVLIILNQNNFLTFFLHNHFKFRYILWRYFKCRRH